MEYLKKIVFYLIVLEILNLIFGFIVHGIDVFLPYTGFNDPALYYDMDTLYGVTRQRNSKQIINHPWGGVVHDINSLGYRDEEFDQGGVLVVGNSFIEGFGVKNEDRFSEILEKELSIRINNAGSGGVWTPVQGVVLLDYLLNTKKLQFEKILFIMTPGEVINIGKRNPENDPNRSYPYREGEEVAFYKAKHKSFGNKLSLKDKIKRFSKNLFVFKIYNIFKYYGAPRTEKKELNFDPNKLDWLLLELEKRNLGNIIDIVVVNNLGKVDLIKIEAYSFDSEKAHFHVLEYPDDMENYFVANGHLNETGNSVLAKLLKPILKK